MITFSKIWMEPTPWRTKQGLLLKEVQEDIQVFDYGIEVDRIKKGFISDGNSFPFFIRLTWDDPWHQRYIGPALWHDQMLVEQDKWPHKWEVDLNYLKALRSTGVSALESTLFYHAVRIKRSRP